MANGFYLMVKAAKAETRLKNVLTLMVFLCIV